MLGQLICAGSTAGLTVNCAGLTVNFAGSTVKCAWLTVNCAGSTELCWWGRGILLMLGIECELLLWQAGTSSQSGYASLELTVHLYSQISSKTPEHLGANYTWTHSC